MPEGQPPIDEEAMRQFIELDPETGEGTLKVSLNDLKGLLNGKGKAPPRAEKEKAQPKRKRLETLSSIAFNEDSGVITVELGPKTWNAHLEGKEAKRIWSELQNLDKKTATLAHNHLCWASKYFDKEDDAVERLDGITLEDFLRTWGNEEEREEQMRKKS